MKTYYVILQGSEATEKLAREFASQVDFSEMELSEYSGTDNNYVDSINGIDIYYQYGANYYFFAPSE